MRRTLPTCLLLNPGQHLPAGDPDVECGREGAPVGDPGADQEALLVVGLAFGPSHNPDQGTSAVPSTCIGGSEFEAAKKMPNVSNRNYCSNLFPSTRKSSILIPVKVLKLRRVFLPHFRLILELFFNFL